MQLRINQRSFGWSVAVLMTVLAFGLSAGHATADDEPATTPVTNVEYGQLTTGEGDPPAPKDRGQSKVASSLFDVIEAERSRDDWKSLAEDRGLLVNGDSVLVEMRLNASASRSVVWQVERLGGRIRHHNVPSLLEVWLPVKAIKESTKNRDVLMVRPARLVRPTAGSVTSEGVSALNIHTTAVDYDYHDLGADGSGVVIANIDAGYSDYAILQTSGDWPAAPNLRRFEVDGGSPTDCDAATCSDYEASDHGSTTMEIVFDVAPGADYLTYRTTTVGDWYTALTDAADRGAEVVTVSLSAPLDNVGDGSICPPNAGSPCGTIAEAAQNARSNGVLMVVSAGNYRTEHWGGDFADDGSGYLDWDGSGSIDNIGGPGGGSVYCYPNGYPIGVDLFWDDWTDVDHDYDLYLYEYRGNGRWRYRAGSFDYQNGGAGQVPQESIRYTVSNALGGGGICSSGQGIFSIRVQAWDAPTDRNLQVFGHNFGQLWRTTPDRSLGFPADSPDVYAVGAVDVGNLGTLEDYSSEGPALGPGGSQAAPSPVNPKPDAVSVSGVSTVTYGPSGFGGTSSAAPHTAGIAAILTQLRNEKYTTPPPANNPDGIHDLLSTFALEDSTFPASHDTTRGHGLAKLRFTEQSVGVTNGNWVMLGLPCTRRSFSTVAEVLGDDLDLDNVYWEVWEQGDAYGSYIQLFEDDQMVPGVGYWLLYEGDATVDIQGLVQDRSEAYPVQLKGEASSLGWANFVGHPFETGIDWPDVRVFYAGSEHSLADAIADGVMRNFMWGPYTATGYVESDGLLGEGSIASFDGFWVKAFEDTELRIPITMAASRRPTSSRKLSGWTVHLDATQLGVTARARLGQQPDSKSGWDLHDAEHMPSFEAHQLAVVMPHPEWGMGSENYVRDYHGHRRTDVWRFEVKSNIGGTVDLRWSGPDNVMNQSVVVDLETGKTIPASKIGTQGYRFKMPAGAREFEWRLR